MEARFDSSLPPTMLPGLFEDVSLSHLAQEWFEDGGLDDHITANLRSNLRQEETDGLSMRPTANNDLIGFLPASASDTAPGVVSSTTTSSHPMLTLPYPSPHPLSMAKHICAICGDRASGKHYGVHSCEGCKGFFKRTVRKDLSYSCRESRQCIIDKRQRNRCQYCRYQKCQTMGMKKEAVQEERQRHRADKSEGEPESTTNFITDISAELIHEAELIAESKQENYNANLDLDMEGDTVESHIGQLVDWAQSIPHFSELQLEDQALLLQTGWNELILAAIAYRSSCDALCVRPGYVLTRAAARGAHLEPIFERISNELTAKMRSLCVDRTELGCLRTIVLYNPDAPGLKAVAHVETCRERVYTALEEYCRSRDAAEPGRFAKLLLRLPALRSVGIKCLDAAPLVPAAPPVARLLDHLRAAQRPFGAVAHIHHQRLAKSFY